MHTRMYTFARTCAYADTSLTLPGVIRMVQQSSIVTDITITNYSTIRIERLTLVSVSISRVVGKHQFREALGQFNLDSNILKNELKRNHQSPSGQ